MVGRALARHLNARRASGEDIVLLTASRSDLDLTNQAQVADFLTASKPDVVIIAAAKVGGIQANSNFPAAFLYENLMIECNVVHQAFRAGVKRLLSIASSSIYPTNTPQPMGEEALLKGSLDTTHEPYAIAKIAGIKLCESYNRQYGTDYRSVVPTNLYGPYDKFDLENGHVLPAMIRRFHEAKVTKRAQVTIWGSGAPRREFLHVDDMAEACLFVLDMPQSTHRSKTYPMNVHINVGSGSDISILELARLVAAVVGYNGEITSDPSKPDGVMQKLSDISVLQSLGWCAKIDLRDGIDATYRWYLTNHT